MSFAATFCAAPPLRFRGAIRNWSSRSGDAQHEDLLVSKLDGHEHNPSCRHRSPDNPGVSLTRAPNRLMIGAEGVRRSILLLANVHIHARLRTKRQSFLCFRPHRLRHSRGRQTKAEASSSKPFVRVTWGRPRVLRGGIAPPHPFKDAFVTKYNGCLIRDISSPHDRPGAVFRATHRDKPPHKTHHAPCDSERRSLPYRDHDRTPDPLDRGRVPRRAASTQQSGSPRKP